jgi:hypothetical protein
MPTLKYQSNSGIVGLTRVSGGAVALYGDEPAGAASPGIWFYKSGSRRNKQLRTRNLVLRRVRGTIGTAPNEVTIYAYARATVGTSTAWDDADIGSSVTYNGQNYIVADKQEEG